jgi:hypothetical protein
MPINFGQFWELVKGAETLDPNVFRAIETQPDGTQMALTVLLLAGLSQAIGQGIVLFVNRVKPIRFVLSLGIAAILFVISTAFWILSVWFVSHVVFSVDTSFTTVFHVLGLAFAPLIWSFLIALPYLGVPIGVVLSIWSLLAFVRGFNVVTGLDRWQAVWCALIGWVVFQIMQRTIGRPAAAFGEWLSNSVAGTQLVTTVHGLEQIIQSGAARDSTVQSTDQSTEPNRDRRGRSL